MKILVRMFLMSAVVVGVIIMIACCRRDGHNPEAKNAAKEIRGNEANPNAAQEYADKLLKAKKDAEEAAGAAEKSQKDVNSAAGETEKKTQ